jgi:hypothetical protein
MMIRPVGVELFDADRRTDMKLIVAFRNFANAPKRERGATFKDLKFTRNGFKKIYSKPENRKNFDISTGYDCKIQIRVQQLWRTNSTVPLLWHEMGTIRQKISIS